MFFLWFPGGSAEEMIISRPTGKMDKPKEAHNMNTLTPTHYMRDNIHTVSLFVANKPGVLLCICLVFSRRGFNIESLVVSPGLMVVIHV